MTRMTLEIYLPAAERTFDVQVPADARLGQVAELAAKALSGLSGGLYEGGEAPAFCDRATGELLDINMPVWELFLRPSSRLMLI